MRPLLLAAAAILFVVIGAHPAAAQPAPLDPAALAPAVTVAISQYAQDAGHGYAGDCQTAGPQSGETVCTLVFPQDDGSLLAAFYPLADDGSYAPQPIDTLVVSPPIIIPPARLVIPSIRVNAAVVTLGVIAETNTLDSPKTKDDIGYYDFTPAPGYGGNTVLSGHIDWYTRETGVFWDLKLLAPGDAVQLIMPDGTVFAYTVTETHLYDNNAAPLDEILDDTPVESVTLVTCEGVFDPSAAEYDKRRVVRAERVFP